MDLKPQKLLRAMQACGAIFFKTPVAQAFVEKTLRTCRDFLVHEFVRAHFQLVTRSTFHSDLIQGKPSRDPKHQLHVIVTLTLLQMIGLFHQDPQQRASSNIYHGMLVLVTSSFIVRDEMLIISKMVRQYRLIERSGAWQPQTFPTSDPAILDETWHNWAIHESVKRYLIISCLNVGAHGFSCAL